jgi:hypothetical protein
MFTPPRALALAAIFAAILCGGSARAEAEVTDDPPLIALEGRVGYGMAFGGGAGVSVERWSPITLSALVETAVWSDPWASIFAGVAVEGHGRGAAGAIGGLRVRPTRGQLRLSGGLAAMFFPETAFGPVASGGTCLPFGAAVNLCGDVEATMYVIGSDIPDQRVAGQIQLVVGVGFDAL